MMHSAKNLDDSGASHFELVWLGKPWLHGGNTIPIAKLSCSLLILPMGSYGHVHFKSAMSWVEVQGLIFCEHLEYNCGQIHRSAGESEHSPWPEVGDPGRHVSPCPKGSHLAVSNHPLLKDGVRDRVFKGSSTLSF